MKNTTAMIFLFFAVVVSFGNILLGNYQYIIFCFPFLIACVLPGKMGKAIETLSLAIIGIYVLLWQKEYTGMVILYASSIWFFVYIHRDIRVKIYIAFISLFIAIASYILDSGESKNIIIHAIMDSAFYGFGAIVTLVTIKNLEISIRQEIKPIDKKYFALLDNLSGTLHEMMDTIKKMQEGAQDDRSRKDC